MIFLKLLLTGSLIFIAVMADKNLPILRSAFDSINYNLPDDVVPVHYNVKLIPFISAINYIVEGGRNVKILEFLQEYEMLAEEAQEMNVKIPEQYYFYGQSNINVRIFRSTQKITLNLLHLDIAEEATMLFNKNNMIYKPSQHLYVDHLQMLALIFDDELSPGDYVLNIKFVGRIHDDEQGLFRRSYWDMGMRKWLIGTHFKPFGARQVFPCWDQPTFKTTFNISVKHHPAHIALSNMPKRTIEVDKRNGMIWTHFYQTPKMSTYQVAVMVCSMYCVFNCKVATGEDVLHSWWCNRTSVEHIQFAMRIAKIANNYLNDEWSIWKEIMKVDHVIIPNFRHGGVENWGLILYREADITYIKRSDLTMWKIEVARVVMGKMIHQLFDNLVSPSWWSYVWINEGLANFFASYINDQAFQGSQMVDLFVVQAQHDSLHVDTDFTMFPLSLDVYSHHHINFIFSSFHYILALKYKAPVIMRMLQHMVTNEVFQKGIDIYLNTYRFSSATPDDLWSVLQTTLNGSDHKHKFYHLKEVMNTWTYCVNYPVLNLEQDYYYGIMKITPQNPESVSQNVWIPLTYTTQTKLNFTDTSPERWLRLRDQISLHQKIDEKGWIIANLQQAGYYRVNYDLKNWRKIASYLNSDEFTKIHVLNRAQIINDAYHFLMTGKLNFFIFLELTKYLSRETDYIAWYPMFKAFEHISPALPLLKRAVILTKVHMRNILADLLNNIGYEEKPREKGFTKCLRQEATKWACIFGDSKCHRVATRKLQLHLRNSHEILPGWKEWTYCKGLMKADPITWKKVSMNELYNAYAEISDKRNLELLTCSEDSNILIDYLNKISWRHPNNMTDHQNDNINEILQRKEYNINIFLPIIAKHARNNKVLQVLLKILKKIDSRVLSIKEQIAVFIIIINNIHAGVQFDMIEKELAGMDLDQRLIERKIFMRVTNYISIFLDYYGHLETELVVK